MIAGVSRELVARLLRDPGVEPFAVMCKSLGMPRSDFFALVSRQDAESPLPAQRAEDLLGIFDSMARDYARAVLRYWDWDGNPRIARITRLLGIDDEVRNGFGGIRVHFAIDADASEDDIKALVAQSQKRSAVFDVITNPTGVVVTVN